MKRYGLIGSALAVAALTVVTLTKNVGAQNTPGKAQIQLAFGYDCGDLFQVRNDGTQPVDVEYALQGNSKRTSLHLNAAEAVQISSEAQDALELWVNGRIVSTERKGNRACAQGANSQDVIVRPLGNNNNTAGGNVVYVAPQPARVVYGYDPYYSYDPWYYGAGYDYPYAGYGYGYPGYRGGLSISLPIYRSPIFRSPIILSRGGGSFGRPGRFGHSVGRGRR